MSRKIVAPNGFSILQVNVNKSQNVLQSLLNDQDLKEYAFLLLTEPWSHISKEAYSISCYHLHRLLYYPSKIRKGLGQNKSYFRVMIWGHKDYLCRQILNDY